jgi:hypothetical protein
VGLTTQEDPALMFTTSSSGPGFADPATTSTGGLTSMTVKARVRPTSLAATSTVWSVHNGPVFIGEIMTSGALRVTVRDGTGTQIAQVSTATGTIVANQWATIVAAVDLPNLTLRVWIDGALKIDVALAANNGVLGRRRSSTSCAPAPAPTASSAISCG